MKKFTFTDVRIKALPAAPEGKRTRYWDAALPHFGIRVTDQGKKTFVVWRRMAGKPQPIQVVLGAFPTVTTAEARKAAPEVIRALAQGIHPKQLAEQRRRAEAERNRDTFESVALEYMARSEFQKMRTVRDVEGEIRRELISRWGEMPLSEIARRDVLSMVEAIQGRGANAQARKVRSAANALFNWAMDREIIAANPCARVKVKPVPARLRILSDDELSVIWHAAKRLEYPWGTLVQVLMLTGARLREIAEASWTECDLQNQTLTIPPERAKTQLPHVIPLTPVAMELLANIPRFDGFIFSTTAGKKPIAGFSRAKRLLGVGLPHWQYHDLRRTYRTRLGGLGVPPHIAELCIGHARRGMIAVYDQWTYAAEKREANERWAELLMSIVGDNVTKFGTERAVSAAR